MNLQVATRLTEGAESAAIELRIHAFREDRASEGICEPHAVLVRARPTGQHGFNLCFPRLDPDTLPLYRQLSFAGAGKKYRDYGLTFLDDTHGYEFLEAFFQAAGSS